MTDFIMPGDEITASWLTAVLRQGGLLARGEVISFECRDSGAFNSQTSFITLVYSSDVPVNTPMRIVLKLNQNEDGADEVKFYQQVAKLSDHPPIIVSYYAAAYDEQSGSSYLILQDLSETHAPPVTRDQQIGLVEGVPTPQAIDGVVDALARLHAYWWGEHYHGKERFDVGYWYRDAERFGLYLQRRKNSWSNLLRMHSDWFPTDLRALYEDVLTRLPQHWRRYVEPRFRRGKNLTLVHGDAYFANFLSPRIPGTGLTYLLDWQSPSFDIGGLDLANLCAAFWTSEQRREDQREQRILRYYYDVLLANGVKGYSWDELLIDYRIGLIFWLLMPVQDCSGGSKRSYWWPKMQCLITAFREWHCEELLS